MSLIKSERRATAPIAMPAWPDDRFDRAFRGMFRDFVGSALLDHVLDGRNLMHIEEYREDDTYVLRAELPGIDPDNDVEINVSDSMLHVSAHREERTEDKRGPGYRSEFRYGEFERSVALPKGVAADQITASYKDGILEVRVPAKAAALPSGAKVPVAHD